MSVPDAFFVQKKSDLHESNLKSFIEIGFFTFDRVRRRMV